MGQKVTPISLRLHVNRDIDACWYTERKYDTSLLEDMHLRSYIGSTIKGTDLLSGRTLIHRFPSSTYAYTFVTPKVLHKQKKQNSFGSKYHTSYTEGLQKTHLFTTYLLQAPNSFMYFVLLNLWCMRKGKYKAFPSKKTLQSPSFFLPKVSSEAVHINHMNAICSKHSQTPTRIFPMQFTHSFQSADAICEYIVGEIEKKKSFRSIWKTLLQHVKATPSVKGFRVVCAGRIGGAEMARVESRKWGQSSFHVFSNKIDYAAQPATTSYGLIGIKVWICYG